MVEVVPFSATGVLSSPPDTAIAKHVTVANGVLFIVVILYGSATFEAEVKIASFDVVNDIIAAASPSTLNLAIFAKNRGGGYCFCK